MKNAARGGFLAAKDSAQFSVSGDKCPVLLGRAALLSSALQAM